MIGRKDAMAVAALCAMTLLLVILISPVAEVAFDDAWNFVLPTKHFLETGRPTFDPFNSAAAVLHILWGGLFCSIFGLSFSVCRIANIVLTLITSIVLYFALRQAPADEKLSFAGAAAFAANPILMTTSFTYQSDIAYLTCAFGAVAFYLRYLRTLRHGDLILATAIASLSVWNKMHGLLLPLGALVYFFVTRKQAGMRGPRWLSVTLIPAVSVLLFRAAKPIVHPVSTTLDGKMAEFQERLFSPMVWAVEGTEAAFFMIMALGIYALPLFAGWLFVRRDPESPPGWIRATMGLFWTAAVGAGLILIEGVYPFHSSMLREMPPMPDTWANALLTWLAWPAGALLGYHLTMAAIRALRKRDETLFLFALLIPQMLILIPIKLFMDRYFLVLFPLVFLILIRRFAESKFRLTVSLAVIALFFAFGAARIDQYKAGTVAQWEGAKRLTDQGVSTLNIDAGYAWTGWNNYEHSLAHPDIDMSKPGDSWYIHELCRTTEVKYLVTFWPPHRAEDLMETIPYRYWLGKRSDLVYISRRGK